jgi:hypothetical protein
LKKIFSISLLLFLFANLAGFYVYFYFRLEAIHKEMKAALRNLPEEKLQKISFSPTAYQQSKNEEGEIEWNGAMYDVAKIRVEDERVIVYALRDEAETNLLAFFESIVNTASSDDESPPTSLTRYSSLTFILSSFDFSPRPSFSSIKNHAARYARALNSRALKIPSPPPRADFTAIYI